MIDFLCLVAEADWSNPNVNIPMWGKYGSTSQLIEHEARQSLTVFVHVLFTHICISFILGLFNYIHNNDELWCFKLIWFLGGQNKKHWMVLTTWVTPVILELESFLSMHFHAWLCCGYWIHHMATLCGHILA